ncbi:hypothetical protein [Enterococcus larvae]|nr:hypothetical protein [Enterococcus larvae]
MEKWQRRIRVLSYLNQSIRASFTPKKQESNQMISLFLTDIIR